MPALTSEYGLLSINGRICIFGGKTTEKYSNELLSFCSYSNVWLPVTQNMSNAPSPRIPLIFSTIRDGNIFVFSGRDENTVFDDAYVIMDDTWVPLKI